MDMIYCIAENCDRLAIAKGYCDKHRKQMIRHGRLTPDREHRTTCTIDGCDIKHFAKGYCRNHYYKYVKKVRQNEV